MIWGGWIFPAKKQILQDTEHRQACLFGVRFTDAYSACVVCSPTRAALDRQVPGPLDAHPVVARRRWNPKGHKMRTGRFLRSLPLEERTLAENLREEGMRLSCRQMAPRRGSFPARTPWVRPELGRGRSRGSRELLSSLQGNLGYPHDQAEGAQAFAGGANGDYLTDAWPRERSG